MKSLTDVIEYLINQKRKDLVDVLVKELKQPRIVVRESGTPLQPILPNHPGVLKAPYIVGDDPSVVKVIC